MNCEPCNSWELTCNHNVTIAYLKELVGNIQDSSGRPMSVVGDDTYCPTYGELVGGSLIQNFSDGGNGSWHNNVDGIVVTGSYSNNQCVQKEDITLIYTRFESLTVSNPSPIVGECGGSTTTTRTLTFRKYTKKCDEAVSSTTQADTTLTITWTGTDGSNTGTKTYSRNTSFTDTHPSTVSCFITWRGSTYTSSNSVTVSQKVRQFDHYDDYARSSGTSVDVYCTPWDFDCHGGTSYATATYYYDTWTDRHYIDTCDVDYYQEDINIVRNNTLDVSSYLNAQSHTYEPCTVTTPSASRFTFEATYDGFYDSDYAQMDCAGCEECPPGPSTAYTDVSASCSDGSATVTGTIYTHSGGELDGEGHCINYTTTETPTSYNVNIPCTTVPGWIDTHVYVTDGPCCPTGEVYTYETVWLECESADSFSKQVAYTCVTTHADGSVTTVTDTSGVTIPAVSCNGGDAREIATSYDKLLVMQSGGCDCCTCEDLRYTELTAPIAQSGGSNVTLGTYTATCVSSITATSNVSWITGVTASGGVIKGTVEASTETENERSGTITLTGVAKGETCTRTLTVRQSPQVLPPCGCEYLVIT